MINETKRYRILQIFVVCTLLVLLGVLVASVQVSALGVTPARTTVAFSPGLQKTVHFTVVNSEHKNMSLVLYAQGELNGSISLPMRSVSLSSANGSVGLQYAFTLPKTLSPGPHTAEVVALELPPRSHASSAYVGATVGVTTQLYVMVPYPGTYAAADMNVINAGKGGNATFIFPIANEGKTDLSDIYANVDIYNAGGGKVASFNTPGISIAHGQRGQIVYGWKANVSAGNYRAVATVVYAGKTIKLEKSFTVGSEVLDLQQVSVNKFKLGGIAKMDMLVANTWSEPIQNAYTVTDIYNAAGGKVATFKSPTYTIPAQAKAVMSSYWDTSGLQPGTYTSSVYVTYGNKSAQHDLTLKVSNNNVQVVGLGLAISPSTQGNQNTLIIVLVTIMVGLIIINLSWFLFLRKRFRHTS